MQSVDWMLIKNSLARPRRSGPIIIKSSPPNFHAQIHLRICSVTWATVDAPLQYIHAKSTAQTICTDNGTATRQDMAKDYRRQRQTLLIPRTRRFLCTSTRPLKLHSQNWQWAAQTSNLLRIWVGVCLCSRVLVFVCMSYCVGDAGWQKLQQTPTNRGVG